MKIEFEIDDKLFEEPFKVAVSREVASIVRRETERKINKYTSQIEAAVETYLAKRLTDKIILSEIEQAVKTIIEERLRDN